MTSASTAATAVGTTQNTHMRAARVRDDRRLFAEQRRTGDPQLRAQLIERFMPLARSLARRYRDRGEPFDDLLQVAYVGLTNAVDRFDVDREVAFSTFAVPSILGELRRHFRDRAWAVRPPRGLQELALRVAHSAQRLDAELGRPPTVAQIAAAAGVDDEQVLEALEAHQGYHALSFSRPAADDHDGPTLGDRLADPQCAYGRAEDRVLLERLGVGLTARQRLVIGLRYEHDMTQAEIGKLLGVSQMQSSRIIRQSLERLRAMAAQEKPPLMDGSLAGTSV